MNYNKLVAIHKFFSLHVPGYCVFASSLVLVSVVCLFFKQRKFNPTAEEKV